MKKANMTISALLLVGCSYNQINPITAQVSDCQSGNCNDGYGALYDKNNDVLYEGVWRDQHPQKGQFTITKDGKKYYTKYQNGSVVSGEYLYFHGNGQFDRFNGEWQTFYDPFTDRHLSFPSEGVYDTAGGGRLIGTFTVMPTMGHRKESIESLREQYVYNRVPLVNVLFAGSVEYGGSSELVTMAMQDHIVGWPLISPNVVSLAVADERTLNRYKQEYNTEKEFLDRKLQSKLEKNKSDSGGVFSVLGAFAVVAASVNAGATNASSVELGKGTLNALSKGDYGDLSAALDNIEKAEERVSTANQEHQIQNRLEQVEAQYGGSGGSSLDNAKLIQDGVEVARLEALIRYADLNGQNSDIYRTALTNELKKPVGRGSARYNVKPNLIEGERFCNDERSDTQVIMHCKTANMYYAVYLSSIGTQGELQAYNNHKDSAIIAKRVNDELRI
ncbi:hypothetical protein [Vibrio barjaei]|uniref:hypothetical protein n=1 Tax=Vibrio barjaei TaxID=1676683 RepID=UPI0022851B88|nr:hypothetical protein [Vibrio barjaei]MCY9870450.1 hypothetical protein [Vibrio barjaei]